MVMREARTLSRDVEVAAIPYGDRLTLTAGTTVYITQALGGSYTAMTDHGYLVRIEGSDADAIGEQPTKPLTAEDAAGRSTEQMAWDQLKTCFDPEIPVNIWELGLIYDVNVSPEGVAAVKMTLTAPACPVAGSLPGEVEQKIKAIPGITDAKVELVWDPPWNADMMSRVARVMLGM